MLAQVYTKEYRTVRSGLLRDTNEQLENTSHRRRDRRGKYCCAAVLMCNVAVPYRRLQLCLRSPFLMRYHLANHSYRATHEQPQHGSVNARCLEQLHSPTTRKVVVDMAKEKKRPKKKKTLLRE